MTDWANMDPGDVEFFEGRNEKDSATMRLPVWWAGQRPVNLDPAQMRAVGRVVALGMTNEGLGYLPEGSEDNLLGITDEDVAQVSSFIGEHVSSVLRQDVTAYWTKFLTQNDNGYKDNIVITFLPKLLFNGTAISFHLERPTFSGEVLGAIQEDDEG